MSLVPFQQEEIPSDDNFQLDNRIGGSSDRQFERVVRLAMSMLKSPFAAVWISDHDRQYSASIPSPDIAPGQIEISQRGNEIIEDEPLIVADIRFDSRFSGTARSLRGSKPIFYAGYPVRALNGQNIGSICIVGDGSRQLSQEDIHVLRDLAAVAEIESAAMHLADANNKLISEVSEVRHRAQVDSLTRTWNRESIFLLLNGELARAQRYGNGIGLIMADVDHFKRINDTLGHSAGDEVLSQIAKRTVASVRAVDAVGRYGGEEFMIALGPCHGLAGAALVAQRIRKRVAESPITTATGPIQVTMSLGVAFCESAHGVTAQMLFELADEALYSAKRSGRNRVEFAPSAVPLRKAS